MHQVYLIMSQWMYILCGHFFFLAWVCVFVSLFIVVVAAAVLSWTLQPAGLNKSIKTIEQHWDFRVLVSVSFPECCIYRAWRGSIWKAHTNTHTQKLNIVFQWLRLHKLSSKGLALVMPQSSDKHTEDPVRVAHVCVYREVAVSRYTHINLLCTCWSENCNFSVPIFCQTFKHPNISRPVLEFIAACW